MSKRGGYFRFPMSSNPDFGEVRQGSFTRGSDPDFLYYNAQIINNSTATTQKTYDPDVEYQDTRSVPILQDKSKYAISVENFTLNGVGKNLPIFVPQIREYNSDGSKNTNPNNTVYDITFTAQYGGTKSAPEFVYQSTRSIQWIPENQATWTEQPLAVGTYSYPQEEIPYYYCYTYSHWVKLVNSALALAWADVKAAALAGGVPGLTIVINSLNGTFTKGGLVQDLESGASGFVVEYTSGTNTLILYNIQGTFNPGDTIFQEPDVGTARITTTSFSENVSVPAIQLGTKCPFFAYDPKTNLFSIAQDANTCVTPFGSPVSQPPFNFSNPPSAQDVFGSSTATGYVAGEYSFVGYNTNLESLLSNFNSTYYSDQVAYPSKGALGVSINSPNGTESVEQATAVINDSANISGFVGNQMNLSWNAESNVAGSNWVFGPPKLIATGSGSIVVGQPYTITYNAGSSYLKPGIIYKLTTFNAPNVNVILQLTSFVSNILTGTVLSSTAGAAGTYWYVSIVPVNSETPAIPIAGTPVSLVTDLFPGTSVIQVNHAVTATGPGGQSFNGLVSSYEETLNYTGGSGGGNEFVSYANSTLPNGFNPIAAYTAQSGKFVVGDVVKGTNSAATAQIIDVLAENSGQPNVVTTLNQNAPFQIGDTITVSGGSATVTNIEGPNTAASILRTGILSISPTYSAGGTQSYAGPFSVGDTVAVVGATSNSAIITEVDGDNGYTIVDYQQQKNPYAIGATVECYASLASPGSGGNPLICSGTITAIDGDNKGWGTMNFTDQNCKFGVGETIVDNSTGAVATIVQIQGDNNGYAYISYINQLLTGALGNFVPGEFLLVEGNAFAKVVVDNQSVANNTEGNIGIVTCITGEEVGGIFYATSNVPLPFTGQQIQGSLSGTLADFGGVAYKDTGVLILNNICGTFYVGDLIVDSVGYGLPSSKVTSQATAVCNGMAYLGGGRLTLKNTQGTGGALATFPSGSFLIDFASAGTSNPLVVEVQNVTAGDQFYQGAPVSITGGYAGVVIANNGPTPYGNLNTASQLLTILPSTGSSPWSSALVGQTINDSTQGTFLALQLGSQSGPFFPGDVIQQGSAFATIQAVAPLFPAFTTQLQIGDITGTFTSGVITNLLTNPGTPRIYMDGNYLWWNENNTFGSIDVRIEAPLPGGEIYNWDKNVTTTSVWSDLLYIFEFGSAALFAAGDVIQGVKSQTYGIVGTAGGSPAQMRVYTYNGSFVNGEKLLNLTNPSVNSSDVIANLSVYGGSSKDPNTNSIHCVFNQCNPVVAFSNTDSIGVLPFIDSNTAGYATSNVICSGANLTLSSNYSQFIVGSTIYIYNGTANWNAQGTIVSIDGLNVNVAFKAFTQDNGGNAGFSLTNACGPDTVESANPDYIGTINYYTNGFFGSSVGTTNNNYYSGATVNTVSSSSSTTGIVASVASSPSNAFIQTFRPPQTTTALKVSNVQGTFASGINIQDANQSPTSYGNIGAYSDTTDYSGTLTTLNVKNVTGSANFISGAPITFQTNKTANVGSATFQNGSLMLKPINSLSFQAGETITDLGSNTTATITSAPVSQTIVGETSSATATILIDNGSQLKLGSITGTFQTGEEIQSNAGTQAQIEGISLFGVGNTVTSPSGSATIVSDNGTQLLVNKVTGEFSPTQTITSVYEGVTSTATLNSVTNPTLVIVPTNSTGESGSWTIVPQALTSSTTVTPPESGPFTTNLTIDETIFDLGDYLAVVESVPALTVEQLYYPENVVQIDMSAGNCVTQTLQSLFPSSVTGTQYVVLSQDYESTSSLWSPVASIVVGTQFLTVREEYSGTPITIGTGNLGGNATTGSFQKVLLETPIDVLPQESWRGLLTYTPKVETLSSLGLSKEDLKNLDIQLYWRNRLTNSLTPLTLYNGGSANIRLQFKRIHE